VKRTGLLGAALAGIAMVAVAVIGIHTKPAAHTIPFNDVPQPLACSASCPPDPESD
jgi:hypothetical protein